MAPWGLVNGGINPQGSCILPVSMQVNRQALSWTNMLLPAGETPVCLAKGDGECQLTAPKSPEYCAGQNDTASCPRFQDFKALYMRGEKQVAKATAIATAATNSLVFNAFIWLQVHSLKQNHTYNLDFFCICICMYVASSGVVHSNCDVTFGWLSMCLFVCLSLLAVLSSCCVVLLDITAWTAGHHKSLKHGKCQFECLVCRSSTC